MYLNLSRPDITFSVYKLNQFLSQPRARHLQVAHHLLCYIKSASGYRLFFTASFSMQLKAFSDADWASCPDSRKSTTNFCVFLGDSLVSWKSKKQSTISHSFAEPEYRAMAIAARELIWIRQLLGN